MVIEEYHLAFSNDLVLLMKTEDLQNHLQLWNDEKHQSETNIKKQ